jgi:uncharacterized damage-inducible protein DinB
VIPFAEDYLKQLETLHSDVEGAIADLPQEALDWKPGPDINSICVLVVHLTGSERYWIGDVAFQETSNRDRDAEFVAHGLVPAELRQRLAGTLAYARKGLDSLALPDLDARRHVPNREGELTVAWALLHALEHAATHVGQIQLMRDLWRQKEAGA